jgi:hypothetical protein
MILGLALPLLAASGLHAEAAPLTQARPISTASPTPGVTDEAPKDRALSAVQWNEQPPATVAYVSLAGASPAPVPEKTVSPEAPLGSLYR